MVTSRAYSANLGDDLGYFLDGPSFTEFFESPKFQDLEIDIFNAAVVVAEYFNFPMAFQAGHRVNGDLFHDNFLLIFDAGKLNL
jgi:hypothetical protein